MDGERFDRIKRGLGTGAGRREALRLLLAAPLALRARAAAATCTLRPNGTRCAAGGQCCSGV